MNVIFETKDKTGRQISLTKERWSHITSPSSPHAYMTNHLEEIKETLANPLKIIESIYEDSKVNYYRQLKKREHYLKVIVKYLNGTGFIISAYFVRSIK